ncbi:hypothetical protein SADUNF_Sadunf19G0062200 [Salix dunnii]|uniref:C3H1-type domain-containing protein n=1 Tax=Salix dunnii TaxID=1413687 RepID=A0A835J3I6_9ROSI|nr:hypothetical protein SADUNF_Sadunf19G0062200 [Salix dunnii]
MDFDAGIPMSRGGGGGGGGLPVVTEETSLSPSLSEDAMWQMNLRSSETMEAGPYPERPGEPDCSYYIRTGLCRFGPTCRFNHPPNRKLAIATAKMMGEFPERIGQPECQYKVVRALNVLRKVITLKFDENQMVALMALSHHARLFHDIFFLHKLAGKIWLVEVCLLDDLKVSWKRLLIVGHLPGDVLDNVYYLKTGTCKFGATCKFHHPRDKAGVSGRVSLNILGYPLRPGEIECAYYLRTGQCKFGSTCKFHHPQQANVMVPLRGSPVYPAVNSPTTPGQQSYPGGLAANWSRASFITSPRWQAPSSYTPLILPQGVVSVPGWNAYSVLVFVLGVGDIGFGGGCLGQLGSVSSPESQQQTGNSQIYGTSRQSESVNAGSQGTFSPYRSGSVPLGFYALQRESVFPERPGQPECQFYMKTGDCKFGAVCRFHHPRERLIPTPDCILSPIGLPLRPGEPLCVFYSRYGSCKFGPSCKFHHPMGILTYNLTASSSADAPVRRLLGSSSGSAALTLSSEGLVEAESTKPRRLSLSEPRQMPPGDDNIDIGG